MSLLARDLRRPFRAHLFDTAARFCSVEPEDADAGAAEPLDLRGELSAAFDQVTAADAQQQGAPTTPAAPATSETPAQQAERERDPLGRFAKTAEAGQLAPKTETPTPQAAAEPGAQQPQAIGPPATWSAAAKAEFATLSPVIQQEVLRREKDMDAGRAQWQQGAERLNSLDQVLGPRREQFQLRGISEVQAVGALFAAQDMLETRPVDALLQLGTQARVNWQLLFQRLSGAPQQGQPAVPPGLEPVVRQVQHLTQSFAQREQAEQSAVRQQYVSVVEQFQADPANKYFANVIDRMKGLLSAKLATDLPDAYRQACLSDPAVSPFYLKDLQAAQAVEARNAAAAKVAQARAASVSLIGSPSPGVTPGAADPNGTLRDDLSAAWDAHA